MSITEGLTSGQSIIGLLAYADDISILGDATWRYSKETFKETNGGCE